MNFDEAKTLLEKYEDEFLMLGSDDMRGLNILSKYEKIDLVGEHDIVYICKHNDKITEEELITLYQLGFHLDEDGECWAHYT